MSSLDERTILVSDVLTRHPISTKKHSCPWIALEHVVIALSKVYEEQERASTSEMKFKTQVQSSAERQIKQSRKGNRKKGHNIAILWLLKHQKHTASMHHL